MCPSQMCNYWWTSWAFYGLLASPGCLCSFGFHHGRCLSCCRGFIAYQVTGVFSKFRNSYRFKKNPFHHFHPARRLQQGQRVLLPNGMVAFAMPVRPFKVLHPTRINGINVSSFKQKALRIPLVSTGGKLLVPCQEAFGIGLANLCLIQSPSSGFVFCAFFARQATSDNAS